MQKKAAKESLETFFESTYADAVARYCASFGTLNEIEDAFSKIYLDLYKYLLKQKSPTEENIKTQFEAIFKEYIKQNCCVADDTIHRSDTEFVEVSDIAKLLGTEFEISEKDLFDSMLNKKIYSYVMTKPMLTRKAFLLFFYCGYTIEQIALTLNTDNENITCTIHRLLLEIKRSFLDNRTNDN